MPRRSFATALAVCILLGSPTAARAQACEPCAVTAHIESAVLQGGELRVAVRLRNNSGETLRFSRFELEKFARRSGLVTASGQSSMLTAAQLREKGDVTLAPRGSLLLIYTAPASPGPKSPELEVGGFLVESCTRCATSMVSVRFDKRIVAVE